MKIGELKLLQRKNLGDYQHVELSVTAIVEDEETATTAIDKLRKLVKWHLNADEYEAKYAKLAAQPETTDNEKAWMVAYAERQYEIEAI